MAPPKIVILVLENRSFDEYFGMRTDAVGFHDHSPNAAAFSQPGWSEELPTIQPFRASTFSTTEGFGEEYGVFWDPQHLAWNYGAMNGWSIQNNAAGGDATAMSYLAPNDIPYHWTLGETFLLCDTYFCSIMSSTFPNRVMLMSGSVFDPSQLSGTKHIIKWDFPNTNVPVVDNVTGNDLIFNWPSYPNTIGTARSWAIYDDQLWQPNWIAWNNPEPAQPALAGNPQLPAYLAWKDGTGTPGWPSWTPPALNVLDYLDGPVPGNTSLNTTSLGHTGDTSTYTLPNGHVGTYYSPAAPAPPSPMPVTADPPGPLDDVSNFETDALAGNLPDVSWLIPPIFACDHPTRSMPADNELYMARIVHAVTNSPHWDNEGVVLLVTYDEKHGRFDHVRPPASMSDRLQAYGHQGPDTIAPLPTPILGGAGIEPPMPHKPKKPPLGTPWEPWIDGLGTETGSTAYSVIGPAGGGFRVPTVIISPWTFGKQVSSRVAPGLEFDHTSIIQYLEEITGITCPNLPADTAPTPSKPMGGWRRATFASLGKLIDHQRPRASTAEVNAALGTAYNNVDAWRLDALTRLYGQTPANTSQSPPTRPVLRSPGPSPTQDFPPVPQRCRLTIETSTFDVDEIRQLSEAAYGVGHPDGPVTFQNAFSVVVDGFELAEVDLGPRVPLGPGQTPPPGQVPPLLPGAIPHSVKATLTLDGHPVPKIQVGGSLVDAMTATVHPVAVPQNPSLGDVAQSFLFAGDIHFPAGAAVFDPEAHIVDGGSITLRLRADFTSRLTFGSPEEHIHLVGPPTHSSTGKIVQLSFDRFGDFEGFVVETGASHHVRFDSRKAEVADLVRWAWADGIRVTVYSRLPHHREPERIVLHAPG